MCSLDWFGSEYYLKLYRNRNFKEAKDFINVLLEYVNLKPKSKVIDVCCGRGRHSIYLASKGYDVDGIDNAENSILYAKKFEKENLKFKVQNILNPFGDQDYDLALNLFTSFGYFDNDDHSLKSLVNIANALKKDGEFIIDFLNEHFVVEQLTKNDEHKIDGIQYSIVRIVDAKFILKKITVTDGDKKYEFREQVRRFGLKDFEFMLGKAGMQIEKVFGDYSLNEFDLDKSERLIIHAIKV